MSLFFQTKIIFKEIILTEENEIVSNDENTAHVLNTIFSNIVDSPNIPDYVANHPNSDVSGLIVKLTVKYRKDPSILIVGEVCKEKNRQLFLSKK